MMAKLPETCLIQGTLGITDLELANALERSSLYSDRAPSVVGEFLSHGMRLVLMPYGPRWRVRSL